MNKYIELKKIVKSSSQDIKSKRDELKELQRKRAGRSAPLMQAELMSLTWGHRHHQIAYSELLGRSRDQIETPNENNNPSEPMIRAIKERFNDESLCIS